MIDKLPYLADLGIDAVWVSPWYPSPMADGGYDVSDYRDIHPDFGTLEHADAFISKAHELGLRVLIDLVPNHSSDAHPWFQAALAAPKGSPEREMYIFRDGLGEDGDLPPNNWPAMFGGGAWERTTDPDGRPGQWYLHLFAPEQPDWNWDNPAVVEEFDAVLRFWFDRGVDGFPDRRGQLDGQGSRTARPRRRRRGRADRHHADRHAVPESAAHPRHLPPLARSRRRYAGTEQGARVFVSEAYVTPASELASYIRPDELHTTFNFDALLCEWTASSQRSVIDLTLAATGAVGAPATWVLANHDMTRVVTRYGRPVTGARFTPSGLDDELLDGIWLKAPGRTDVELGRKRARAAALLELALPGGAYVYQGDELGLEEVEDLPEELLQDPTWERSGHAERGRDGCRVPIPWSGCEPPFGFGSAEQPPWLPQPAHWAGLTAAAQDGDPASMLTLYRTALAERRRNPALGDGTLSWDEDVPADVLSFVREPGFRCVVNFGPEPYALPPGHEVLVASAELDDGSCSRPIRPPGSGSL